jgi:hypothetical protein
LTQLLQPALFEYPRPLLGEPQLRLAVPHGMAGDPKAAEALHDPPVCRGPRNSSRVGPSVGGPTGIEGGPERGLLVNIDPQMMPIISAIDVRFPH